MPEVLPRSAECDPSQLPDDAHYLFVSYAHLDLAKVKPIVDALHREGFNVWYDKQGAGIDYGKSWKDFIFDKLGKSSAFLSFVSQHNEYRPIVIEEMAAAIKKHEEDPTYPVVFVCLEKVSAKSFALGLDIPPDEAQRYLEGEDGGGGIGPDEAERRKARGEKVQRFLDDNQFISYGQHGGLTEKFMKELMNAGWPESVVDNAWRRRAGKGEFTPGSRKPAGAGPLVSTTLDFPLLAHYEYDEGKGKESGIRTCSPDQVSRNVAYPVFLDNQWVPEELYADPRFKEEGLPGIARQIQEIQRQEIYRCLLNNWQIAVNRAAIWNSGVFQSWYRKGVVNSSEVKSFGSLVENGVVLVFLMGERHPAAEPKFDHDRKAFQDWRKFCRRHKPHCLRLDWENDESNAFECNQLIAVPFQDFYLSTASNFDRIEQLRIALGIDEGESGAFQRRWSAVRDDVVSWTSSHVQRPNSRRQTYSRERFYQEFVAKERDEHGERISIDRGVAEWGDKPFSDKLKRVIDLQYAISTPLALQIQPVLPADAPLQPYLLTNSAAKQRRREVGKDELTYAFGQFEPVFAGSLPAPRAKGLSLRTVVKLRGLASWKRYMSAVSECKERSRLDQIDFADAHRVWGLYGKFVEEARTECRALRWKDAEAALTVVARFEEHVVSVVYRPGSIQVVYRRGSAVRRDGKAPWDPRDPGGIPAELRRKVNLTVHFVCGDAEKDGWSDNPLLAEHCMFDGLTRDEGHEAIEALLERLDIVRGAHEKRTSR